jgi:hypothetical protein
MVLKPNKNKVIFAILPFFIPFIAFIFKYLIILPRNPAFDLLMLTFLLIVFLMALPVSPLIHIFGIRTAGDFLSNVPDSIGGFVFLAFVYFILIYLVVSFLEKKSSYDAGY